LPGRRGWLHWGYPSLTNQLSGVAEARPAVAQIAINTSFRMFPDSAAAKGEKGEKPRLSAEAMALQQMMRGIHF
jgi:hypothetical protein